MSRSRFGSAARLAAGCLLAGSSLLAVPTVVRAQAATDVRAQTECAQEAEPNDTPEVAASLRGALCIAGTLPDTDQDLLIWNVTAAEAAIPWTFLIDGVLGTITSVKVVQVTTDPGVTPIETGTEILHVDALVGQFMPVAQTDLLFPEGRYLVGVVRSTLEDGSDPAHTDYALSIAPGEPLPVAGDVEPNDGATTATPLSGGFDLSGDLQGSLDTYAWTIGDADPGTSWDLKAVGPLNASIRMTLRGPDDAVLASVEAYRDGRTSLYDLRLPPATYVITIEAGADRLTPYSLRAAQSTDPSADAEPNDSPAQALPFDLITGTVRGRLAWASDRDDYRLSVDPSLSSTQFDLKLIWGPDPLPDSTRQLCLLDAAGTVLQCHSGSDGSSLTNLLLPVADYVVEIRGGSSLRDHYLLRLDRTSAPVPDFELEPNDTAGAATSVAAGTEMRGWATPDDDDYYRVTVAGDPQLWEIEVAGNGIDLLTWVQADGLALASGTVSPDRSEAAITDMYLEPGEHWFRVAGSGGEYALDLTPLGAPDPSAEREPNDDEAHAEVMLVGAERNGRLPLSGDADIYRFSLTAAEHVLIGLEPPPDGAAAFRLSNGRTTLVELRVPQPGEAISYDAALPPGDYLISLRPGVASSGRYHLSISRLDPFDLGADQEPNDVAAMARPFPASLAVDGTGTSEGDYDWYRLPAIAAGDTLTVRYGGAVSGVHLSDGAADIAATDDPESGTLTSEPLASDAPPFIWVSASGDYHLELSAASVAAVAPPGELPVTLSVTPDTAAVSAYELVGQRVPATIEVANGGADPLDLALDARTSHYGWSVTLDQADVTVAPGTSVQVPGTIEVASDAWADIPVRVTVRARDPEGAQVTASADVTPARDVPAVGAEQGWPIPDALLGGLDVASIAAGALPTGDVDAAQEALLHDGATRVDMGFAGAQLPVTLTVDLAGDDPVPVVGTILDPLARDASLVGTPRDFELRLSSDGSDYQTVLRATLEPLMLDQPFVLDEPVDARWAQLVILTSYGSQGDPVALGEWKVVARPGTPSTPAAFNVADPLRGGHVVWMQPQQGDRTFAEGLLSEDPSNTRLTLDPRTPVEWVMAFRADRAAQVTELQWVDGPESQPQSRFASVDVQSSLAGPFGPWRDLGTWHLERGSDGTVTPLVLDEPTWSRFLRFSAVGGTKSAYTWDMPATLRVIERPSDADYRTILGEWGVDSPAGPYEWLQPPDVPSPGLADAPDDPAAAVPLPAGERAGGRVHTGEDVDWYAIVVPQGQNTLELSVSGRPTVGVGLTLTDASGAVVPTVFAPGDDPGTVSYTATVEPGAIYRVEVGQPPSSVVFAFDTSGSMGNYLAFVLQALRTFAGGVTPGQEAVLITPFEEEPLLPDWSDQPYVLQNAVRAYAIGDGSSSAETALIEASTALSARQGARAILLVTDAETTSYERTPELWTVLGSVRPLIFAVHVGATTPSPEGLVGREAGDLMRDWAASAGGVYQYTRTHGEMDRAFDRLATRLRRPASYGLAWTARYEEPRRADKKPGSISVRAGADGASSAPTSSGVSTEIILDTSGSMLERLGRQRKIDVARKVLTDLVTRRLPAGAPVAFRVFGGGADPCGTSLAVPLSPLDPDALADRIAALDVVQKTNTPIGAALREVPGDLADSSGTHVLVLITDGEETCGGDPPGAIRALKSKGIDARVNIVGFGLSDKRLKKSMQGWARLGDGTYFDAKDSAQLARAIAEAVSAPFRVLDANGNEVAAGTLGGAAVKVPPGTYSVVALTDPTVRFEAVVVAPGKSVSLSLPAQEQ